MNMSIVVKIVALDLAALVAFSASCGQAPCDRPLMSMRLRADDTSTKETWKANFKAIMENPGCCDEIWFSTGIGAPPLEWHRARAEVIAEAARDAKSAGIVPSLQFQATIGHRDSFGTAKLELERTDGEAYVTIPSVGAWNGGYIKGQ